MTARERSLVRAAVGAGVAAAALWGSLRLVDAGRAARDAAADLVECRQLAAQIVARRAAATAADVTPGAREPGATELVGRIEAAARAGEFPPARIDRIEPGPPRRVGEGMLSERPTTVELRGVTLKQVFTFLHAVGSGKPALRLRQIRLSAPSPDDAGDRWAVQSTLTYLVRDERAQEGGERERVE